MILKVIYIYKSDECNNKWYIHCVHCVIAAKGAFKGCVCEQVCMCAHINKVSCTVRDALLYVLNIAESKVQCEALVILLVFLPRQAQCTTPCVAYQLPLLCVVCCVCEQHNVLAFRTLQSSIQKWWIYRCFLFFYSFIAIYEIRKRGNKLL